MNVLIIHSAQSNTIKNIILKIKNDIEIDVDKIYVLTFKKNTGTFCKYAEEVYFDKDDIRINALKVKKQVIKLIREKNIKYVVAAYSNVNGNGYENVRVLLSNINVKKDIYNSNLEKVQYEVNLKEYITEVYYDFEKIIFPILVTIFSIRNLIMRKKNKKIMENKKIMLVYDAYDIGGVSKLLYYWGNKLCSYNYNVVSVFDTNGPMYNEYKNSRINAYLNTQEELDGNCRPDFYFFIKKIIKRERPDVVIISGCDTILPGTFASLACGVHKIIKLNNGVFFEVMNNKQVGKQLRTFSKFYDYVIAVSSSVKKNALELGIKPEKIKCIPGSSIDFQEISSVKYKMLPEMNVYKKNIICVSRLSHEKGVDVFINSIQYIQSDLLNEVMFYIIGDGPEKRKLIELRDKLGLKEKVAFTGFRNDVYDVLNNAYLTVLSSHTEGLPVSVLESMAMGKMCIASNVGGTGEIVEDGVNGFLFEDNDVKKLAGLITYCIKNSDVVKRISQNARETIREKYDINIVLSKLRELIDS